MDYSGQAIVRLVSGEGSDSIRKRATSGRLSALGEPLQWGPWITVAEMEAVGHMEVGFLLIPWVEWVLTLADILR